MKDMLLDLVRRGATIFLTSHVLEVVERLCDHVAIINQGRIVAEGTPSELRSRIGGGHVVVLETADPASLGTKIEAQYGVKPSIMDGEVRIEIDNGHRFITEVVEAFPGAIESVALHKPTLEDVFVHETGASIE